jgi:hypothetical protein
MKNKNRISKFLDFLYTSSIGALIPIYQPVEIETKKRRGTIGYYRYHKP